MLTAEDLDEIVELFDRWLARGDCCWLQGEDRTDALDEIAAHCRQRVEADE